jgi:hypothetical protein
MNNQLRKIVEQAVSAVDIVTGNEALDDELAKMYIPDCFAEKFAELIVRECAKICSELKFTTEGPGEGAAYQRTLCEMAIKENFGLVSKGPITALNIK